MALAGSIDTFPLRAALSLLASTSARGVLRFSDGVDAELHVAGGEAVAWRPAPADDPVVLLAEVLDAATCRFVFDDATPPSSDRPGRRLGELGASAEALVAEWVEMRQVAPTPAHRVRLEATGDPGGVAFGVEEWALVCAVADGPSLSEVASRLAMTPLTAHRAVRRLRDAGLVRIDPPDARPTLPSVTAAVTPDHGDVAAVTPAAGAAPAGADPVEALLDGIELPSAPPAGPRPSSALLRAVAGVDATREPDAGRPLRRRSALPGPAPEPAADEVAPGPAHAVVDALGDRGPWSSEQLRELVEHAHRETEAALAGADEAAAMVGSAPPGELPPPEPPADGPGTVPVPARGVVPLNAAAAAALAGTLPTVRDAAPSDDAPAAALADGELAGRPVERASLLRFFSPARA